MITGGTSISDKTGFSIIYHHFWGSSISGNPHGFNQMGELRVGYPGHQTWPAGKSSTESWTSMVFQPCLMTPEGRPGISLGSNLGWPIFSVKATWNMFNCWLNIWGLCGPQTLWVFNHQKEFGYHWSLVMVGNNMLGYSTWFTKRES